MVDARLDPAQTANALLVKQLDQLRHIKQRWFMLDAFQCELDRASRGRSMRFNNDNIWGIMLDSRDTAVVVLLDWLDAASHERHGVFAELQPFRSMFSARVVEDDALDAELLRDAHRRCFPRAASGEVPAKADLDGLRKRFRGLAEKHGLRADRNKNRAHFFESRLKSEPDAKMLSIAEMGAILLEVEGILADLLLLAVGSTHSIEEATCASTSETAEDLVDLLLFTSSKRFAEISGINASLSGEQRYAWQFRGPLYERAHAKADEEGLEHFNDGVQPTSRV